MKRREFLVGTAAALLPGRLLAQGGRRPDPRRARLSIMTFNFGRLMKLPGQPDDAARTLDPLDMPQMLADRYDVHSVEYQHAHIPSTDGAYLRDLRARADRVGSRITQINLEFGMANFSAPDPVQRTNAVDLSRQWIDHAATLGCEHVMLNQGQLTPEKREFSIPTLKTIGDYGASKGVKVSMETRAPSPTGRGRGTPPLTGADLPAPPAWVTNEATRLAWLQANPGPPPPVVTPRPTPAWMLLLEHVQATGTYVNPDVGGMGAANQEEMHAGLRGLYQVNAGHVHINFRDNPQWDIPTLVRFNESLGFQGMYTIEVANAPDPYAVTQGLIEVVLSNMRA